MRSTPTDKGKHRADMRPALLAVLVSLSVFVSLFFILSPEAMSQKYYDGPVLRAPSIDASSQGYDALSSKPKESRYDFRLSGSNTFYQIMSVLNVPGVVSQEIERKARPFFDLRRLKQGTVLRVFTVDERLSRIEYRINEYQMLVVKDTAEPDVYSVEKSELAHETRQATITGTIENSLYEDGLKAGADSRMIANLTDIFAWDIDFASDIRKGDRFNILSEMLYVEGKPVRTGRILGAEMVNGGKKYTAIYFEGKGGEGSYFNAEGKSLRRSLLKSPLRFSRITSHFSKGRFHPIHKRYRPHHGIDYGAPTGTPIESAGSGIVKYAGWKGGYGNFIEIKHNNGFSTAYGHLSRIAKGVRTGAKITQGQVIGAVGSTGISTGPHLHYEVKASGKLINPLSVKPVADNAIAKKDMSRFASVRGEIERKLSGEVSILAANQSYTGQVEKPAVQAARSARN